MNYQIKLDEILEQIKQKDYTPKLLLHACCAPCSSYVLEVLSNYFEITIYYYNPNIYPENEFIRRMEELKKFITEFPTKNKVTFIELDYNSNEFYQNIKGLEKLGERSIRCYNCYKFRMEESCKYASINNFDYFTRIYSKNKIFYFYRPFNLKSSIICIINHQIDFLAYSYIILF